METLEEKKHQASKLYSDADEKGKELLIKLFGEEIKPTDITDLIKTFEDACRLQNIKTHGDAFRLLKLDRIIGADEPIHLCDDDVLKAMIIIRGLNEGWWAAKGEKKWFPIFDTSCSSGFGFSNSAYGDWRTDAGCGSRLCLKNEKLSNYMGAQFTSLFKNILIV